MTAEILLALMSACGVVAVILDFRRHRRMSLDAHWRTLPEWARRQP